MFDFLDRIQGRLVATFALFLIGTAVIFYMSYTTIRQVNDDISTQLDQLRESTELTNKLQAAALDHRFGARRRLTHSATLPPD